LSLEGKIPYGVYCYDDKVCPYWYYNKEQPPQMTGGCTYLNTGDWEEGGTMLLFDQVKECGVNEYHCIDCFYNYICKNVDGDFESLNCCELFKRKEK